jgi:hypothetical protein
VQFIWSQSLFAALVEQSLRDGQSSLIKLQIDEGSKKWGYVDSIYHKVHSLRRTIRLEANGATIRSVERLYSVCAAMIELDGYNPWVKMRVVGPLARQDGLI